eukprot:GFYU01019078.1.p1 GENE.GFYU01019078.1~~GFYU01019078.1.p1  ORF type:complete len:136 (-),score=49.98 GFYU01019078.1:100-456(-)
MLEQVHSFAVARRASMTMNADNSTTYEQAPPSDLIPIFEKKGVHFQYVDGILPAYSSTLVRKLLAESIPAFMLPTGVTNYLTDHPELVDFLVHGPKNAGLLGRSYGQVNNIQGFYFDD